MTAATLFSGIGAPEMAMPEWHWAWSAEIEKFPSAVLAARHPHSINLGDVTAHDFTEKAGAIATPDVLVFGSPCQSFSVAGKRLGLDDPRGNLALVALGIVARLKPRWFVFENVPGLLSSAEGSDFGLFLRAVDELGHSLAWAKLDAQYFGVAQRRERLFAVGYSGDWRYPATVLFEPESVCGNSAPRREARARVAGALGTISPGGGWRIGADEAAANHLISHTLSNQHAHVSEDGSGRGVPIIAHAINAHGGPHGRIDFESETFVTHALRADGFDASEDGTGCGTPLAVAFNWQGGGDQTSLGFDPAAGVAGVLQADQVPAVAFQQSQSGMRTGDTHATLDSNNGSRRHNGVMTASAVRRLTPRECERLQGFPDDYTAIEYRGKSAADGPRYKALGNSMAVPVVRWILERIERTAPLTASEPTTSVRGNINIIENGDQT